MMNNFYLNFVTFFGVGNIKFAPGTLASALICLIFYFFIKYIPFSFWFLLTIFFLSLIYAPYAINKARDNFVKDDPSQIVIDEVLGMFIPLLFLSLAFQIPNLPKILHDIVSIIWGSDEHVPVTKFYATLYYKNYIFYYFVLFRIFDIFKPFPIGYVDKKFKNSFGILLDDILAGFYCVLFPYLLILLAPLLTLIDL